MTVRDLIDKLKEMPPEAVILVDSSQSGAFRMDNARRVANIKAWGGDSGYELSPDGRGFGAVCIGN